ncbi:MAG: hypothetical protein JNK12_11325 [Acidimicrobiales bacterium]|nr:hypothetical protein [Acidimicrobiales bacterium]
MALDRLTTGDKVLALSTLAFVLSMFLPWFGQGPRSTRGWDYAFFGIVPLVLVVASTGMALTRRLTGTSLPELPVPMSQLALTDAGVAALLVLVKVVLGDDETVLDVTVELRRRFGIFLALAASAGACLGASLNVPSVDDAPSHGPLPPHPS